MVLRRWEVCEKLFLLFVVAAVVVRFEGKYSAVAGLVHAFEQNASHNTTQILACFSGQLD